MKMFLNENFFNENVFQFPKHFSKIFSFEISWKIFFWGENFLYLIFLIITRPTHVYMDSLAFAHLIFSIFHNHF